MIDLKSSASSSEKETATGRWVEAAFDVLQNVYGVGDAEIADRIRNLEADIVIDLHGYTHGMRTEIVLRRPAPIQVNYLGFPGTMGAPFMDYIIADKMVIPEFAQEYYSERIAWLPDTYQPNDDKRPIPALTATRADFGLPPNGFVFCSFNKRLQNHARCLRCLDAPVASCRRQHSVAARGKLIRKSQSAQEGRGAKHRCGDNYEALALKLARDPALLASIKAKLAANRLTAPLFDTKRYTRHLEAAYITMYERALRGKKPESFVVEPLP